ncbi:MAG: hypothetical protein OEU92_34695, partial [Alphaproteobacteria bacterium]|nr:hypothetical protein [Alphaproteobacteria bacterium]
PSRAGVDCGGEGQRPCTITERIPSCNIGLVEDFAQGRCVATADTPRIRVAEAKLAKLAPFIASKLGFAQQVASNQQIKASLKSDPIAVSRMVNTSAAGQPASDAFGVTRTITIGASAGAKVIFGGSAGAGVALDISTRNDRPTGLPPYVYGTADYSKSLGFGANAGIDVGFWICQNNKIGGDSWGVEFGVWDIGVLAKTLKAGGELSELVKPGFDFGVTLWFDYNNVFQGFTMTPGIGAGADFGGLVKAGTIVEDDPSVNCDGSSKAPGGAPATSVSGPAAAFPGGSAPEHGAPAQVTFYQHCDYQGYSVTVPAGRHMLSSLRAMGMRNDDVSSIRVAPNSLVRIYVHDGFGGTWQDFTGDVRCLVEHGFNDALSSAVVQ